MKEETLSKKIIKGLLISGAIYIAASSPYFAFNLSRNFSRALKKKNYLKTKYSQYENTFYYLKRRGYLDIQKQGHQIYIYLTKEGKKRAGKYQIDDLKIEKPKKWDGNWRVVIFDIPSNIKIKREAFRGKLKELGFQKLQQSVWVHAYDCKKEIELLREFFGLTSKQLKLISTHEIEDDSFLRKIFKA